MRVTGAGKEASSSTEGTKPTSSQEGDTTSKSDEPQVEGGDKVQTPGVLTDPKTDTTVTDRTSSRPRAGGGEEREEEQQRKS